MTPMSVVQEQPSFSARGSNSRLKVVKSCS